MIRLIACDLDGTVFDDEKNIDSGLKEVVDRLKEKGIRFTVVSGRNHDLLKHVVDYFDLDTPYMTNNGANIYLKDECVLSDTISDEAINKAAKILHDNDVVFRMYSEDGIYQYGDSDFFKVRIKTLSKPLTDYDPKADYRGKNAVKITADFIDREDKAEDIARAIKQLPGTDFFKVEDHVYCVNSATANKGEALQRVCDLIGVDIKEAMAFGDSENDLPMLQRAGVGVAMANGEEIVKAKADYIAIDNNHNGVSVFLKDYFKDILL
ncbi:MAG: HAD family hydrolase [Erysipelotrichaceae bacterium]|nr:HAD family hydrolase [Erysipelotrichaceae bacterium]